MKQIFARKIALYLSRTFLQSNHTIRFAIQCSKQIYNFFHFHILYLMMCRVVCKVILFNFWALSLWRDIFSSTKQIEISYAWVDLFKCIFEASIRSLFELVIWYAYLNSKELLSKLNSVDKQLVFFLCQVKSWLDTK